MPPKPHHPHLPEEKGVEEVAAEEVLVADEWEEELLLLAQRLRLLVPASAEEA